MKRIIFLLAVVVSIALPAFAQQGSEEIKGRVLDEATGEPIIGANISVAGGNSGTVSDLDGNFSLRINRGGGYKRFAVD